jgi:hypothetical protein
MCAVRSAREYRVFAGSKALQGYAGTRMQRYPPNLSIRVVLGVLVTLPALTYIL